MSNLKLKCMRKLIGLFVFLAFAGIQICFSQTREVTGTVIDKHDKSPLPGVSVVVKSNPGAGVATDVNGKFSLKVNDGDVLVFSFIGMKPQEVAVKGQTTIHVEMENASETLDEVMVVAYGTAKKESFTGSAAVVGEDKIEKRTVASVSKAIEGTVAGVQTTVGSGQPGEGAGVVVRGFGSLNASNSPLYVVDGVPYDGNINAINPSDIETLTILKDASAGALYGARGANGVVMITTKRAAKGDKINVQFKALWGIADRAVPRYDLMNEAEFIETNFLINKNKAIFDNGIAPEEAGIWAINEMLTGTNRIFGDPAKSSPGNPNIEQYNPYNMPVKELIDPATGKINPEAKLMYHYDWLDEATAKNPLRQDYLLNISGGNNKTKYLASLGYLNEDGILKNTSFERITGRLNIDSEIKEWLKMGASTNFAYSKQYGSNMSGAGSQSNVWESAAGMGPIYPVYELDENYKPKIGSDGKKVFDYGKDTRPTAAIPDFNSIATLFDDIYEKKADNLSARGFMEVGFKGEKYGFLNGFSLAVNIGFDNVNTRTMTYYNPLFGNAVDAKGRLNKQANRLFSYTFNQLLKYNRTFNDKHELDVLAGHEYYDYKSNALQAQKTGFPFPGLMELGPGTTIASANSAEDNYRIESYLTRVNYGFDSKYYLSGSFRTDGSSRFHTDSRWGKFWSVGASWRISHENFMESASSWLDNLTIKASYGSQGNDNLLDASGYEILYAWQSFYDLGYPNSSMNGAVLSSLENKGIKWEKNKNLNVGFEAKLLKRIDLSFEYYNRKTEDLLMSVPMATSLGFDSYTANVGSMRNTGIEVSLGADIFRSNDFSWRFTLLASTVKNEILKLVNGQDIIGGSRIHREGETMNSYYLPKSAGVDPATGKRLYWVWDTDASGEAGEKYISSDPTKAGNSREVAGSRIPDVYGSIGSDFTFKGFDLSVLTTYSLGGKLLDGVYNSYMNPLNPGGNMHRNLLKRAWKQPGDITDVPRITFSENYTNTSANLIDASYFAIKNITFGYTFPKHLMNKIKMESIRIFFTADNVAVFSKLKGLDPQASLTGSSDFAYTPVRNLSLGIDIKF